MPVALTGLDLCLAYRIGLVVPEPADQDPCDKNNDAACPGYEQEPALLSLYIDGLPTCSEHDRSFRYTPPYLSRSNEQSRR